eukprot:764301-Pyramimonas_sp.AAC.1
MAPKQAIHDREKKKETSTLSSQTATEGTEDVKNNDIRQLLLHVADENRTADSLCPTIYMRMTRKASRLEEISRERERQCCRQNRPSSKDNRTPLAVVPPPPPLPTTPLL